MVSRPSPTNRVEVGRVYVIANKEFIKAWGCSEGSWKADVAREQMFNQ
jgi:hypothetical protein